MSTASIAPSVRRAYTSGEPLSVASCCWGERLTSKLPVAVTDGIPFQGLAVTFQSYVPSATARTYSPFHPVSPAQSMPSEPSG